MSKRKFGYEGFEISKQENINRIVLVVFGGFFFIHLMNARNVESCQHSLVMNVEELAKARKNMMLPCGLHVGSSVTLIGKPLRVHSKMDPKILATKKGDSVVWVSQFMLELQGLKAVDGEDPPRVLHFNPRLRGDWSGKPVIEQNTCYHTQWGSAQRCEGSTSKPEDETVDSLPKCENWRTDVDDQKETTATWWLHRLMGHTKKTAID